MYFLVKISDLIVMYFITKKTINLYLDITEVFVVTSNVEEFIIQDKKHINL